MVTPPYSPRSKKVTYRLRDETYRLVEESDKSRKYEFIPIIAIDGGSLGYNTFMLRLENVGRGLAQNILIFFPTHAEPYSISNISDKKEPIRKKVLSVQPSQILTLPDEKRRIRVEYLDVFGRKIIAWASVWAETREENHPRKDHLILEPWHLELPEN